MDKEQVKHILRKGEGLTVEFKKATTELPSTLFETVCAFLNRDGGIILLGVSDDGTVLGLEENKIEQFAKNIANLSNNPAKLDPVFLLQPTIVEIDAKKIIHLLFRPVLRYIKLRIKFLTAVLMVILLSAHMRNAVSYTSEKIHYIRKIRFTLT
jgi:predicted HTH transcriptional regulator